MELSGFRPAISVVVCALSACASTSVHVFPQTVDAKTFSISKGGTDPALAPEEGRLIQVMERKGYVYAPGNMTGIVISLSRGERRNNSGWSGMNIILDISAALNSRPLMSASIAQEWDPVWISWDSAREKAIDRMCEEINKGIPEHH
jgi:hypothetical protein